MQVCGSKSHSRITQGLGVCRNPGADAHVHNTKYPGNDACYLLRFFTGNKDSSPRALETAGMTSRFQRFADVAQEDTDEVVHYRIAFQEKLPVPHHHDFFRFQPLFHNHS